MYHFVKFGGIWYLKPETIQDVIDHFNKICGREFEDGFNDFKDNVTVIKSYVDGKPELYNKNHSNSVWRNAVELTMQIKDQNWIESASSLERQTFNDRIEMFNKGKAIYLRDGITYYCCNEHPTYDEEVWKETLEYPYAYQYDDCRFIQWPDGRHWYAKCGNIDIVDKFGCQKWLDKSYAQKIAKAWCSCGGNWDNYKNFDV